MSDDPRCGSSAGYQAHGDRGERPCDPCRAAQADYQRHYRTRMYLAGGPMLVDATGTRRRLQALARIGWSWGLIGGELGVTGSAVSAWTREPKVHRATADRVARIYDELSMVPGRSVKTAGRARAKDWPPPLGWDDDEIDDPAARPHVYVPGLPGRPKNEDLDDRIVELTRAGLTAAQIAIRLRTYKRHVQRVRARNREQGDVA